MRHLLPVTCTEPQIQDHALWIRVHNNNVMITTIVINRTWNVFCCEQVANEVAVEEVRSGLDSLAGEQFWRESFGLVGVCVWHNEVRHRENYCYSRDRSWWEHEQYELQCDCRDSVWCVRVPSSDRNTNNRIQIFVRLSSHVFTRFKPSLDREQV